LKPGINCTFIWNFTSLLDPTQNNPNRHVDASDPWSRVWRRRGVSRLFSIVVYFVTDACSLLLCLI